MSFAFSDYLESALLNATLRNVAFTSPSAVYLALFTADVGEAGPGTEVSGGSYARQAITFGAPAADAGPATTTSCANTAAINFPTATANWGTIGYWAIFDASSGGNMLYHGALSASVTCNSGSSITVDIGQIIVSLD